VQLVSADELPILDEPMAVELANTLYGNADERIDFLGEPRLRASWLAAARLDLTASEAQAVARRGGGDLVALRDAVRSLFLAQVDREPFAASAVEMINAAAARGTRRPRLELVAGRPLRTDARFGDRTSRLLAELAELAIEFVGSADLDRVRRCSAPDCAMLYVQAHHRRRFCHPSCSHRSRQAAYYRRKLAEQSP